MRSLPLIPDAMESSSKTLGLVCHYQVSILVSWLLRSELTGEGRTREKETKKAAVAEVWVVADTCLDWRGSGAMEEKVMVFRGRSFQDLVTDKMWGMGKEKSRVTFNLLALLTCGLWC